MGPTRRSSAFDTQHNTDYFDGRVLVKETTAKRKSMRRRDSRRYRISIQDSQRLHPKWNARHRTLYRYVNLAWALPAILVREDVSFAASLVATGQALFAPDSTRLGGLAPTKLALCVTQATYLRPEPLLHTCAIEMQ